MNTFKFADHVTEAQRNAIVLSLRRAGQSASRETATIRTSANIAIIGLAWGTTSAINVCPTDIDDPKLAWGL